MNDPCERCGDDGAAAPHVRLGMSPSAIERVERASCSDGVLRLADEHAVHRGARAIDSAGAVDACGPKQNIGAPKRFLSTAIAATSASSVGVVVGKTISVGANPSRSSCATT